MATNKSPMVPDDETTGQPKAPMVPDKPAYGVVTGDWDATEKPLAKSTPVVEAREGSVEGNVKASAAQQSEQQDMTYGSDPVRTAGPTATVPMAIQPAGYDFTSPAELEVDRQRSVNNQRDAVAASADNTTEYQNDMAKIHGAVFDIKSQADAAAEARWRGRQEEIAAREKDARDFAEANLNKQLDTGKFFSNPLGILASIMSVAAGGLLRKDASEGVVNAIKQELENQKENMARSRSAYDAKVNSLKTLTNLTGDQVTGELLWQAEALKNASIKAKEVSAKFNSKEAQAQGQMLSEELMQQSVQKEKEYYAQAKVNARLMPQKLLPYEFSRAANLDSAAKREAEAGSRVPVMGYNQSKPVPGSIPATRPVGPSIQQQALDAIPLGPGESGAKSQPGSGAMSVQQLAQSKLGMMKSGQSQSSGGQVAPLPAKPGLAQVAQSKLDQRSAKARLDEDGMIVNEFGARDTGDLRNYPPAALTKLKKAQSLPPSIRQMQIQETKDTLMRASGNLSLFKRHSDGTVTWKGKNEAEQKESKAKYDAAEAEKRKEEGAEIEKLSAGTDKGAIGVRMLFHNAKLNHDVEDIRRAHGGDISQQDWDKILDDEGFWKSSIPELDSFLKQRGFSHPRTVGDAQAAHRLLHKYAETANEYTRETSGSAVSASDSQRTEKVMPQTPQSFTSLTDAIRTIDERAATDATYRLMNASNGVKLRFARSSPAAMKIIEQTAGTVGKK